MTPGRITVFVSTYAKHLSQKTHKIHAIRHNVQMINYAIKLIESFVN